jgi:phage/plasmid-associated DNA primase
MQIEEFLKEVCEIEDKRAYRKCILNDKYTWRPSGIKDDNLSFSNILEGEDNFRYKNGDGYCVYPKLIEKNNNSLYIIDFDAINGYCFKEGNTYKPANEEQREELKNKIYDDFPFLRKCPYTLSRNKGLFHFWVLINDCPIKTNQQDISSNEKYTIDLLASTSLEKRKSQVYNYKGEIPLVKWKDISDKFSIKSKKKEENGVKIDKQITLEQCDELCEAILYENANEFASYQQWIKLGFAIYSVDSGKDGLELYKKISIQSDTRGVYNENHTETTWNSFENSYDENGYNIGALINRAKELEIDMVFGANIEYTDKSTEQYWKKFIKDNLNTFSQNDYAEMYYYLYGKDNMYYCKESQCFYIFDKTEIYWKKINAKKSKDIECTILKDFPEKMGKIFKELLVASKKYDERQSKKDDKKKSKKVKSSETTKIYEKFVKTIGSTSTIKNTFSQYQNLIVDDNFENKINHKLDFVPIKNCYNVDLRTGEKITREKEDYFTKYTNVELLDFKKYDKSRVEFYMSKVFGKKVNNEYYESPDFVKYMQKLNGYFLSGNISHRCMYFFIGKGKGGKTQYMSQIGFINGDFYSPVNNNIIIMNKKGDSETNPHLLALKDNRLLMTSEIKADQILDTKQIKNTTGGDDVVFRTLYEETMKKIKPQSKIIALINTVNFPIFDTKDDAMLSRMIMIPFNNKFEGENLKKIQEEYLEKFNEPISSILDKEIKSHNLDFMNELFTWCVEGSIRYYNEGLGEGIKDAPEECQEMYNKIVSGNDNLKECIDMYYDIVSDEEWNEIRISESRDKKFYKCITNMDFFKVYKNDYSKAESLKRFVIEDALHDLGFPIYLDTNTNKKLISRIIRRIE